MRLLTRVGQTCSDLAQICSYRPVRALSIESILRAVRQKGNYL